MRSDAKGVVTGKAVPFAHGENLDAARQDRPQSRGSHSQDLVHQGKLAHGLARGVIPPQPLTTTADSKMVRLLSRGHLGSTRSPGLNSRARHAIVVATCSCRTSALAQAGPSH
jgi:hypothetical protein